MLNADCACVRSADRGRVASRLMAFTMIELMVVVAVILILLTIGGLVATKIAGTGEESITTSVLSAAMDVMAEYEVRIEQKTTSTNITQFVTDTRQISAVAEKYHYFPSGTFTGTTILDGWDNEIRYVTNGATLNMPRHPQPYFASAGPDGDWGTVDANNVPNDDAADNVYSFDLDR